MRDQCVTFQTCSYFNLKCCRKVYAIRPLGDMDNLQIHLPSLAMVHPGIKQITVKCLRYCHLSYGSNNREITAESQKIYSYPYYLSVLSLKLEVT